MGFFSTNVLQADALSGIVHVQWTEWYHWGGGGGGGGAGVKWAHHIQLNSPALPDFIDETKTTKENRI